MANCKKIFKILFLVLIFTGLSTPIVFAQNKGFVALTGADVSKVDLAPYMTQAFNSTSLAPFVNAMFKASLAIGAMLAVLQLARAGFMYMGSDMWSKKEQAKHLMSDALFGLLLLLAIWLILNQINPQLLNLDVLGKITPLQDPGACSGAACQ